MHPILSGDSFMVDVVKNYFFSVDLKGNCFMVTVSSNLLVETNMIDNSPGKSLCSSVYLDTLSWEPPIDQECLDGLSTLNTLKDIKTAGNRRNLLTDFSTNISIR